MFARPRPSPPVSASKSECYDHGAGGNSGPMVLSRRISTWLQSPAFGRRRGAGRVHREIKKNPVTADMSKSDPMGWTDRRCQSHPLPPRTAPSRVGGGGPNALHRIEQREEPLRRLAACHSSRDDLGAPGLGVSGLSTPQAFCVHHRAALHARWRHGDLY